MTSEGRWRANKKSSAGKLGINEARPPSHYLHLCSMFLMYIHWWEKADLLYLLLQQPESHIVGIKDMEIRWSLGSAEEGDKKVSFLTSVWSQVTFQFSAAPNWFSDFYKEHWRWHRPERRTFVTRSTPAFSSVTHTDYDYCLKVLVNHVQLPKGGNSSLDANMCLMIDTIFEFCCDFRTTNRSRPP